MANVLDALTTLHIVLCQRRLKSALFKSDPIYLSQYLNSVRQNTGSTGFFTVVARFAATVISLWRQKIDETLADVEIRIFHH